MLQFYQEHRRLIDSLFVLGFASYMPFMVASVTRKRRRAELAVPGDSARPQPPIVTAVDQAGAIGVGVVWTMLFCKGPSLWQLSQGFGHAPHWLFVLLYTTIWVLVSCARVPGDGPSVAAASVTRMIVYGLFLLLAIMGLNDW
jgi:hypothetical protein